MKILLLLILQLITLNILTKAQSIKGNNFDIYLKLQEEIELPNNIIIGNIDKLDCFNKNKFLILDRFGKQVLLFDKQNGSIKRLDPEECHPGFHWRPLYPFFNKKGDIYIINSAPWGFRFDKEGNCMGSMNNSFLATHSFAFNSKNDIIGYYTSPDGNYLNVMDESGIEKFRFGSFPKEGKNIIYRMENGGIITDYYDNIYQLNVNSPQITKYNKFFKKTDEFVYYPSYYSAIKEDLPSGTKNIIRNFSRVIKGKTISRSIFLLDDDIIAIELYHKGSFSYGLELFDRNGNYLLDKEITYDRPIKSAKNGYIYFEYQSEADKNGNIENPSILVYKLILK